MLPVIIVGAGMTGLCLAQALKKADIPFEIYERDEAESTEKGHGWALTVHWAMASLQRCLPEHLFSRLDAIQVDPDQGKLDRGRFLFLNLKTGEPKFIIPPTKRMRLNRKLLRSTLAEGVNIHYGKTLSNVDFSSAAEEGVEVSFTDGQKVKGCLLVGTDGRSSRARRLVVGEERGRLRPIPVRSIGVTTVMSAEEVKPLLEIDPLLFQGSHPDTGVYQWFSLVSTPLVNGSLGTDKPYWVGQLIQSWKYSTEVDNVPHTNEERLALVKSNGQHFHSKLRDVLSGLSNETHCQEITWGEWTPGLWATHQGRVTLAGDAAHAMTSYRGEAFNHAITDAALLADELTKVLGVDGALPNGLEDAVSRYEDEMRRRTFDAVLLSTQACLEAHDLNALHADSPCVSKRAKIASDIMPPSPPAETPLTIALVGGGIIGLILAAGLIRRGVQVKVYEQASHFREAGTGIAFTATTIKCMEKIDPQIVKALRASGSNATSKAEDDPNDYLRWLDGTHPGTFEEPQYEKMLYMMCSGRFEGCRRDQFLDALSKIIPDNTVVFRKRLETIEDSQEKDKVVLKFEDGSVASADAVIGTDGIKSRVRQLILGEDDPASYPHYTNKVAYRALIPIAKAIEAVGEHKALNQHSHVGPGAHLLHYPVANRTMLNCTAFLSDANEWPDDKKMVANGTRQDIENAIVGWNPAVEALVSLMPQEMTKWAIFDHYDYPAPHYNQGRIVLAGDAAHASSPHHGAGAGMGVEDALCLSIIIDQITSGKARKYPQAKSLSAAFDAFDRVRRVRSQWLVNSSRRVCDLYQQPEWADRSKRTKAETCFEEIKDRSFKIWHFDIDAMYDETLRTFEEKLASL